MTTKPKFDPLGAEPLADEQAGEDLTAQIDDAIKAVGQPGEDSIDLRRTGNARVADRPDD